MGGDARLSVLLLLLGCFGAEPRADDDEGPLPRAVALVAAREDGRPLSVYFALEPNPRGRVDVRVTDRIALAGPRGVFTLGNGERQSDRWAVVEEVQAARVSLALPVGPAWSLQRFQPRQAWFTAATAPTMLCDLVGAACEPAETPPPALSLRRAGPAGGFRLALREGTLRFWPPHLPEGSDGERILDDVAGLLAVRWLEALPGAAVREYLDRSFRGVGRLTAISGAVELDGELGEWNASDPDVVESPWQAAVRRNWLGPHDASFSIAARATATRLCFAGRFRDDDLREGDVLTLHLGADRWALPLHPDAVADGLVLAREPFGHRFEVCRTRTPSGASVPFSALLQDRDGEDDADLLATSPLFDGRPAGALYLPP